MQRLVAALTATRGTRRCFAPFRRVRFADCPSSHISSTAYCLSASHVLPSAAASDLALSSRHALSANGGLRVQQDIRQHVVEVSVQALLATTRPCNLKTLATARPPPARFTPARPRPGSELIMNPAKARRRHVDFSGVPQSRKGTSEKSH